MAASAQDLDQRLDQETDRLLITYANSKGDLDAVADDVEQGLTEDRRVEFHAVLRTLFTPIFPQADPASPRLIDFVEGVTGIWGVRPDDDEGRHQFRLSVVFDPALAEILDGAGTNFRTREWGHVLMPGGDDDSGFTSFDVRTDAESYEENTNLTPRIQISYLRSDPSVGEIDIDFYGVDLVGGFQNVFGGTSCHTSPSNSDPLSGEATGHSHLDEFNDAYRFFAEPLTSDCLDFDDHCEEVYETPDCRQ